MAHRSYYNKVQGNGITPLDEVTLASIPTLQTERPWSAVSEKYSFLSTKAVLSAMDHEGFKPYSIQVARTRDHERQDYAKHLIRFRHVSNDSRGYFGSQVGQVFPEVVMLNSHDRASSLILEAGLFRLVCLNGLIASSALFNSFRIRHVGTTLDNVIEAAYRIIDDFPSLEESVTRFRSVNLSPFERVDFADRAIKLRWEKDAPMLVSQALQERRREDTATDLWTVYNRIQENLLNGVSGYGHHRARTVRAVQAIDTTRTLNKGLWDLAEEYAVAHA